MSKKKCKQCGKLVKMEPAVIVQKVKGKWTPVSSSEVCPHCDTENEKVFKKLHN